MTDQSIDKVTGIYSIATLLKMTGLSRVTLWREMRAGRFPRAIQISPRRVGVPIGDYNAWLESRAKVETTR